MWWGPFSVWGRVLAVMGKNAYLFIVADVVVAYSSGIDVLIFSLIERTVRYHVVLFPVAKWVGHTYTHTPSPSDSMPISTITNCGLEFPGLYHRFLLGGHYMYSVCRSQSQNPSPCCCGLCSFGTHRVIHGWESVSGPCTHSFVSSLSVPLRSGIIRCLSFPVHLHLGW